MLRNGRTRALGLVILGALAACAAQKDDDAGGQASEISSRGAFDKNKVIEDRELLDVNAMTAEEVQGFLDKTPWGTRSVLATYSENGKSAAQILHRAAAQNGVNPLVLLVRLQMEHSLIRKETAPTATLREAFGCGCPHSPICSDRYRGFANQADCAAGTIRRSVDRAKTPPGTASGWMVDRPKRTSDGITVTPANPGTAALYTYTPWVGQAGGGKAGVGGASLHWQVWGRFADEVGYGTSGADQPAAPPASQGSSGADMPAAPPADEPAMPPEPVEPGSQGSSGADQPATPPPEGSSGSQGSSGADGNQGGGFAWPDFGDFGDWQVTYDGGLDPASGADSGANAGASPAPTTPAERAKEDEQIASENHSTPSEFGPPPTPSGKRRPSLTLPEDEEASGPVASSGCAVGGTATTSLPLPLGVVVLGAALAQRRRRRLGSGR